jgi:hypothetical protein
MVAITPRGDGTLEESNFGVSEEPLPKYCITELFHRKKLSQSKYSRFHLHSPHPKPYTPYPS